jgi:hypothetical protein
MCSILNGKDLLLWLPFRYVDIQEIFERNLLYSETCYTNFELLSQFAMQFEKRMHRQNVATWL